MWPARRAQTIISVGCNSGINSVTCSTKEAGRGLGVCITLRFGAHCRVGEDGAVLFGEDFPGEASFEIVGAGLRIVEGVAIVFLRMEGGGGRFGERFDSGSGLSIFCYYLKEEVRILVWW